MMTSAEPALQKSKGLRCPECDEEIKPLNGNLQYAFATHIDTHKSLKLINSKENVTATPITNSNVPNHEYRCPVCNEAVEIMYNDVSLSLKVHAIRHRASSEKLEDNRSNCSSRSKKSKKNNSCVKMAPDKLSNSGSNNNKESFKIDNQIMSNSSAGESSILDDVFNAMPIGLKAHRGFMERNSDGKTSCKVCVITIENTFNISEHLKTKSHEDNVITFLKSFVCVDRLYELDFVSVYGFNLSCNLCKCKIDLSSKNPHETIVNILNHNASKSHIKKKSSDAKDSSDAGMLLQSLSKLNPAFVDEYKQYVTIEMQAKISCYLCNEQITYEKDLNKLLKNFIAHFNGAIHAKSANTSLILKIFQKLNIPGTENHSLSLKEGNVYCSICVCNVEAGLQALEKHVKMSITKHFGKDKNNGYSVNGHLDKSQAIHSTTTENVEATNKNKLDVKSILMSMPTQFHNIDYIAQKKGQLFCLICNCGTSPSNKALEEHLTGGKHMNNEEAKRNKKSIPEPLVASSPLNSSKLVGVEPVLQDVEKHVKITISNQPGKNGNNDLPFHKHYNKEQELLSTSTQNFGTNKNELDVKSFLRSMPAQFRNIGYIVQKEAQLFCLVCNCEIPPTNKNLEEHLTGGKHKKNEEAQRNEQIIPETLVASSPLDSSGLVEKFAAVSMDCNSSQDIMLKELIKNDKTIKSNYKFISKEGENYICTLCGTLIKQSSDSKVLSDNFSNHFNGKKHNKNLDQQVKDLLDKLVNSNSHIKTEKDLLMVQNRLVLCTLCSITLTSSDSPDSLEINITNHLSGNKHRSKKNKDTVQTPEVQPEMNQSIKLRSMNVPRNPFMDSIQFVNDQYSYARLGHSLLSPPQPLIAHPPPVPLLNQPLLPVPDTRTGWNLIAHSFKNLPNFMQVESKFMKNGSIDGFLECTLCKCTINPYYLQDHLLEARHVREKMTFEDKTARFKQSRK